MIRTGILNPAVLFLLARVRHTNSLVIADRGFPAWPQIETIDLSLVDDVPRVARVVAALRQNDIIGHISAAEEFREQNGPAAEATLRNTIARAGVGMEKIAARTGKTEKCIL